MVFDYTHHRRLGGGRSTLPESPGVHCTGRGDRWNRLLSCIACFIMTTPTKVLFSPLGPQAHSDLFPRSPCCPVKGLDPGFRPPFRPGVGGGGGFPGGGGGGGSVDKRSVQLTVYIYYIRDIHMLQGAEMDSTRNRFRLEAVQTGSSCQFFFFVLMKLFTKCYDVSTSRV